MNLVRTAAAIVRVKVADWRLTALTRREQAVGVTEETPEFLRLNGAAADADANPYLPDRFRDPYDVQQDPHDR